MNSLGNGQQGCQPEDLIPPELKESHCLILGLAKLAMMIVGVYILSICAEVVLDKDIIPECSYCTHIALAAFLLALITYFNLNHRIRVYRSRKEDRSKVESLIQEANHILTYIDNNEEAIKKYEQLKNEVHRLESELGPEAWTEFQVLTLQRLLVDHLGINDLKARALSALDELKEYAEGNAFSYNVRLYYDWEEKIKNVIEKLNTEENSEETGDNINGKDKGEELRANLKSLYEHIAIYELEWSRGSTIVSGITICGSVAAVIFMIMGILPVLNNTGESLSALGYCISILEWGFLGIAGATASALIGLRNADEVEVGNTFGRRELRRMVLGAPLGLFAGILAFSVLSAGLIDTGSAVPNLDCINNSQVYLSIIWAVGAGMGMERVFQKIHNITEY